MKTPRIAHVTTVDLSLRFLVLAELLRLRDEGFDVTAISAPGPWVAGIEAEGIRHIAWTRATRSWAPASDVRAFRELLSIFRRERFDLVHTHTPKAGVLGRIAARAAGVPCVVNTVHGFYARPDDRLPKKALVLGAERIAARCSGLELFQNEADLRWARRLRLAEPGRLVHVGNGVDLAQFDPACVPAERRAAVRAELGVADDVVLVGTVARLVAEKGVRELVAAARALRSEGIQFVVVGGAEPEKPDAIGAAELEQAAEHVVFTGTREDVRDLLAALDIFVLASWREGLPRAAMEAAAMQKPLVLTDIRGCRELARDGVEALFVPRRDAHALTAAIARLARDPALRERIGAAARVRALERFDQRRMLVVLVDRCRALLAQRGVLPAAAGTQFRRALVADAPRLARLHRDALPDAFMSRLGERFLRRFYRALCADPGSVVVAADEDGVLIGFAAASTSTKAFSRRFSVRHGIPAALAAARASLRPGGGRGLLESARYASAAAEDAEAELMTLVVERSHRRRGIGRRLVSEVRSGLEELGSSQLRLFTASTNEGMNGFAARLGFRPSGALNVHRGVRSNGWVADWRS